MKYNIVEFEYNAGLGPDPFQKPMAKRNPFFRLTIEANGKREEVSFDGDACERLVQTFSNLNKRVVADARERLAAIVKDNCQTLQDLKSLRGVLGPKEFEQTVGWE